MEITKFAVQSPQNENLFSSLPDELILKIVKMASKHSSGWAKFNHTFIVGIISRISVRFSRIATDISLWKGNVVLCGRWDSLEEGPKRHREIIPRTIDRFLGEGVKRLKIAEYHDTTFTLSKEQMKTIARKCPDLVYLNLQNVGVDSWPFGTIFSLGILVVDKGVWTWTRW